MPKKIIIDCDPGQDDAVALFLAMSAPDELDVLGVTTVAGNVPLELTQRNARIHLSVALLVIVGLGIRFVLPGDPVDAFWEKNSA